MCDPIIDLPKLLRDSLPDGPKDEYSKVTVEEYKKLRGAFTKYPIWHYSQLETDFNINAIKKKLVKFAIPIKGITATIIGGFTGEFAIRLRDIGMNVVFTDPRKDWVQEAINKRFESYRCGIETIPREIIEKTNVFASFECYPAFKIGASKNYDLLKLFTAEHGLLFAESNRTRELINEKHGVKQGTLKRRFCPFARTYGIKRGYTGANGVRLYHFWADKHNRELIKIDCRVIKNLYDDSPSCNIRKPFQLDRKFGNLRAKTLGLAISDWQPSIKRILDLYQPRISDPYKRALYHLDEPNVFRIYDKVFSVSSSLL